MSSLAKPTGSFRVRPARRGKYWFRPPHCRISALQIGSLLVGEDAAAREEADAERRFHREARATARYHIDDELRVPPVLELGGARYRTGTPRCCPDGRPDRRPGTRAPDSTWARCHRSSPRTGETSRSPCNARSVSITRAAVSVTRTRWVIEPPCSAGRARAGKRRAPSLAVGMCRRSGWHFVENDRRCRKAPDASSDPVGSDRL